LAGNDSYDFNIDNDNALTANAQTITGTVYLATAPLRLPKAKSGQTALSRFQFSFGWRLDRFAYQCDGTYTLSVSDVTGHQSSQRRLRGTTTKSAATQTCSYQRRLGFWEKYQLSAIEGFMPNRL